MEKLDAKVAESKLHLLISAGYLILAYCGCYCSTIKKIGDVDRYVFLEWRDNSWVIITQ